MSTNDPLPETLYTYLELALAHYIRFCRFPNCQQNDTLSAAALATTAATVRRCPCSAAKCQWHRKPESRGLTGQPFVGDHRWSDQPDKRGLQQHSGRWLDQVAPQAKHFRYESCPAAGCLSQCQCAPRPGRRAVGSARLLARPTHGHLHHRLALHHQQHLQWARGQGLCLPQWLQLLGELVV